MLAVARYNHLQLEEHEQLDAWSKFVATVAVFVASRGQPKKENKYSEHSAQTIFESVLGSGENFINGGMKISNDLCLDT